ncbi:MAG: hypothetical protein WKF43_08775 [Acidimicrobiales bacterium]
MSALDHRRPGLVGVPQRRSGGGVAHRRSGPRASHRPRHRLPLQAGRPDRARHRRRGLARGHVGAIGITLDDDGGARLADGTLAGSAITLDGAVGNVVQRCGVPLERAVAAASTNPSALLGLHDRGALALGRRGTWPPSTPCPCAAARPGWRVSRCTDSPSAKAVALSGAVALDGPTAR